jgi:hypothetical protein
MRKPKLHRFFKDTNNNTSPGLSNFLAGVGSKGMVCNMGGNLCFIPAGPIPPNPVELLASNRFAELMQILTQRFDRVIVDGPPHPGFADSMVLSGQVGGVVLVSSMGETTRDAIRHFKKSMLAANGKDFGLYHQQGQPEQALWLPVLLQVLQLLPSLRVWRKTRLTKGKKETDRITYIVPCSKLKRPL